MKDIHEVKDIQPLSFNHVHCRGVAARARSVHTGSWAIREGQEHAHNCSSRRPILQEISTDHPKSTNNANNTEQPGQHQKAHKDVDDIPPTTTHFLRGWSKSTSTQSTTFHTLKASPPARL